MFVRTFLKFKRLSDPHPALFCLACSVDKIYQVELNNTYAFHFIVLLYLDYQIALLEKLEPLNLQYARATFPFVYLYKQ